MSCKALSALAERKVKEKLHQSKTRMRYEVKIMMLVVVEVVMVVKMLLEEETLEEVGGIDNGEHKDGGQVDCETEFHNVTDLMDISM